MAAEIAPSKVPTELAYALADSTAHASTAACVWACALALHVCWVALVERDDDETYPKASLLGGWAQACLCGALASALDADHFLAAGSTQLADATKLGSRPWGHAALFVLAAAAAAAHVFPPGASLMIVTSWGSHQLRDAQRRGLWLWPVGSTPPLPPYLYTTALALAPIAIVAGFTRLRVRKVSTDAGSDSAVAPTDSGDGSTNLLPSTSVLRRGLRA